MAGRKGGVWRAIVALVCVAVLAGAVLGIRRFGLARRDPAISRDLVSTFASKDGDIVAHHPRELAADAIDESGVKLSGPAGASVTLDETNPAISNDVADLARAALDANRGAGIALTETSRSTATCHGQRALVVEAAVEENAVSRKLHACVFVAAGRSFTLAYLVRDDRTSDEAILLSVVEGAEIKSLVDAPKPASSGVPVVREGDIMASCKSEETACSADGKNLVQCHAGKPLLILRPCLGPSGCTLL
ncbi:MAG TPA: hypothetical protein VIF62_37255, partial [Labilithrix sp.]